MKNRDLILFTNKFPYEGGEVFLETEINYLCSQFGSIYIIPLYPGKRLFNKLPENCFVVPIKIRKQRIIKLIIFHYRSIIKAMLFSVLLDRKRNLFIFDFKKNLYNLIDTVDRANAFLQAMNNKKLDKPIFYSYWFNEWSSIFSIINRKFKDGTFHVRIHGFDYDEDQNSEGYFGFRRYHISCINYIYPISNYAKNKMLSYYPFINDKIKLHYLGSKVSELNPIRNDSSEFQLVSCSNLVPLKRVRLIIDTLANMNASFFWRHFGDGPERGEIENYANQKLKKGTFKFMGFVTNSQLLEYYNNNPVDLFINMSELEGIPVSMMEASAAGIPIVGCNVCGISEIVTEQTGLLLPKESNPETAAIKIVQFLKDKARDGNFRIGVQEFQQQYFNAEHNYKKFIEANLLNS